MTFLAPLGFLAAISIIILVIIYIIKPNYQQKYISSTFVWKLSLKYKKKKVPTSKLRDILIIICQVAILALCTTVLANPSKLQTAFMGSDEVVFVIDSSASMRVKVTDDGSGISGETRYDRALRLLESAALAANTRGSIVSIIKAGDKPEMVVERATQDNKDAISDGLAELRGVMDAAQSPFEQYGGCGYGKSDMNAAMSLCEERVLSNNPVAAIAIYTDSDYASIPDGIDVIDCRVKTKDEATGNDVFAEWNAAILDVKADFVENYYAFTVKVAAYGRSANIGIRLDIQGVNASQYDDNSSDGSSMTVTHTVQCDDGEEKEITFYHKGTISSASAGEEVVSAFSGGVFSYDSVTVRLSDPDSSDSTYTPVNDDFSDDNTYILPGGIKPTLRFHYASNIRTPFFVGILDYLQGEYYVDKWRIEVDTYKPGDRNSSIKNSGFDFYIYEGISADEIGSMPEDGVCLFVGCPDLPNGVSLDYTSRPLGDGVKSIELTCEAEGNPLMKKISAELITVSRGYGLSVDEYSGYTTLMSLKGYPVCAMANKPSEKAVVMSFALAYSNFSILPDFALFMRNIVDYYMPSTLTKNVFEVGEDIGLECRGQSVTVAPANVSDLELEAKSKNFDKFPAQANIYKSGRYIVSTLFGAEAVKEACEQEIFVKMPQSESNINKVADAIEDPYHGASLSDIYRDLAFYFAIAIVFFVFAEWLLHLREGL